MLPHELPPENQALYQRHMTFLRALRGVIDEQLQHISARLFGTGWRAGLLTESPPLLTTRPKFASLIGRSLQDPATGLNLRMDVMLTTHRTPQGQELHSVRLRFTRDSSSPVFSTASTLVMCDAPLEAQLQKAREALSGFDPDALQRQLDQLVVP